MLKTLLPGSPVLLNTIISTEGLTIEEEDRLKVFEFDVSFERTSHRYYIGDFYRTSVAAVINDDGCNRSTIEISNIIS
jgi:hypothetical protein